MRQQKDLLLSRIVVNSFLGLGNTGRGGIVNLCHWVIAMGYFDQLMSEIGSISWRLVNWKHQLSFAANLCFKSHTPM